MLHYRLEGMAERLRYLRSIGMTEEQVSCVLQRLPQLLSLDIRNNLMPKYSYLQLELGGDVRTVASYPAYFSLSLPLRYVSSRPWHSHPEEMSAVSLVSAQAWLDVQEQRMSHVFGLHLQNHAAASLPTAGPASKSLAVPDELPEVLRHFVCKQRSEHTIG